MSLHGLPAFARAVQEDGEEGNAMGKKTTTSTGRMEGPWKGTIHPS